MVGKLDYTDTEDSLMKNPKVLGKIEYDKVHGFSITATKHARETGHDLKVLLKTEN
jgi:hypothetical protein